MIIHQYSIKGKFVKSKSYEILRSYLFPLFRQSLSLYKCGKNHLSRQCLISPITANSDWSNLLKENLQTIFAIPFYRGFITLLPITPASQNVGKDKEYLHILGFCHFRVCGKARNKTSPQLNKCHSSNDSNIQVINCHLALKKKLSSKPPISWYLYICAEINFTFLQGFTERSMKFAAVCGSF